MMNEANNHGPNNNPSTETANVRRWPRVLGRWVDLILLSATAAAPLWLAAPALDAIARF